MFTFGRDHERECAVRYLRDADEAQLIVSVVDVVHDVLEGKVDPEAVRPVVIRAFSDGGLGVWEQTGSWLRKLVNDYPQLEAVWLELSTSPEGKVRFRVACFLNELPRSLAVKIGSTLKDDRHKKTREMAQTRLEEIGA
jgi:hypothetical protein